MRQVGRVAIRRAISPVTLLISLVITSLLVVGCQEGTRYQVLSFFFDGVPVPAGMEDPSMAAERITGLWGVPLDPNDPLAERIRQARAKAAAAQAAGESGAVYTHTPYRKRQCTECHSKASFQAEVSANTCKRCHEKHYDLPADDWIHGPTAQGDCQMCHQPHIAQHQGLLIAEQSNLCLGCHTDKELLTRSYHEAFDTDTDLCTDCHDPHSAGNRLLLVDSASMARKVRVRTLPSKHDKEWDKETCEQCHVAAASKRVVKDVDRICLECHEDVQTEARAKEHHEPVREGKCTSCHKAHKSSRPHLIEPKAEQICIDCHELKEITNDRHPSIRRGDCLQCHTGHSSGRLHLLRDAAYAPGIPAATQPAATQPATTRPAANQESAGDSQ